MSELFTWKDFYSLGVPEIDRQHKTWFAMLNRLHSALSEGKGTDVLYETLRGVVIYTATHFDYEESEMRRCGYPGYKQHKEMHDAFKSEVNGLQQRANEGQLVITLETMTRMVDWLSSHVTGEDRLCAPYMMKEKAA